VLLRKPKSYAEVYNDLDGDVVNLFRVVRDRGDELRAALELTPFAREEFANAGEHVDEPIERARRLVARSFMGFGSAAATMQWDRVGKPGTGFRNNSHRSGTTPAHDWSNYPFCLPATIQRLQGVVIENRDALDLLSQMDGPETIFYADPPYLPETRDKGSDYRHEMDQEGHIGLAAALRAVQGKVIVSGYASDLYERLYAGWSRMEFDALADGARPRKEVLWMNYEPQSQGLLL